MQHVNPIHPTPRNTEETPKNPSGRYAHDEGVGDSLLGSTISESKLHDTMGPSRADTTTVPNLEERVQQADQNIQAHRKHHGAPRSDPLSSQKYASHWHEQYMKMADQLRVEKREHGQASAAYQRSQEDVIYWRNLLQEANEDKGSLMHHHQVRNQLEDSEIINRTKRLRVDIRDFAIHYGAADISDLTLPPTSYSVLLKVKKDVVDAYIQSPSTRPTVIRAFLWEFLADEVFHQFPWAPSTEGRAMKSLCNFLEKHASGVVPEAERKLNIWRADTSNLLLETMSFQDTKVHNKHPGFTSKKVQIMAECLKHIVPSNKSRNLTDSLSRLMSEALALDQVFSQQVARWTWEFPCPIPCKFDPETMDMVTYNKETSQDQDVQLVLAPALVKRGKSSGDEFDVAEVRVKMEVDCDLPAWRTEGSGPSPFQNFKQRVLGRRVAS